MNDYNELIKRLREDVPTALVNCDFDFVEDWSKEAADAIELQQKLLDGVSADNDSLCATIAELERDLKRSKEYETFWEKEANEALKKFQTTVASMPRWIPVEERLPQETQRCIVVSKCGEMAFAIYNGNGFQYPHYMGKATHWMPLPQAPKEET